jgi:predicted ester cyclase
MNPLAVEERNKAVVVRFLEEVDKGNAEAPLETFSPEALWYSPSITRQPMTREASVDFLRAVFNGFPHWQHEIQEVVAAGDKVVARLIDSTTHEGDFQGIPATGARIRFGVICIFRFVEGKIVEIREEGDMLGLYTQIGMELRPRA